MILVVTASDDRTADFLCRRLERERVEFTRLDTDHVSARGFVEYSNGVPTLHYDGTFLTAERINTVWYRRPRGVAVSKNGTQAEQLHTSREWGAAIDGFLGEVPRSRWMNHPAQDALAGVKLNQLSSAARVGLAVPRTLVTRSKEAALDFWHSLGGRVVTKPLAVGAVESVDGTLEKRIYTSSVPIEALSDDEILGRCPALLQERIERGVDVRVTAIDEDLTAVALSVENGAPVDIRATDENSISHSVVDLPRAVQDALHRLLRDMGLRFAAIDLMQDPGGNWWFLEVNPNGQWAWLDQLGVCDLAGQFISAWTAK